MTHEVTSSRADLGNETVSGPPQPPAISAPEPIGLGAACAAGIVPKKVAAARNDRHRDKEHYPKPVARNGLELLYDPVELADYYASRSAL